MWLDNAVVYQIYMRSFQDSDGDGVGDLPGVIERLDYLAGLGIDAIWLSPVYPSPNADYGYDVSDYTAVDPAFGTLADFDELLTQAHGKGLKVILDFVPCHTSIEHRWFREHPDYYVWADSPPNNWIASFNGSAWGRDPQTGRYYLHSFFPEQADLDWHNPAVRRAMGDALRFWVDRGVDGFRLDALDRLLKDPELRDDPVATAPPPLPQHDDYAALEHIHSTNSPEIGTALQAIRDGAGDTALIGEVYLPSSQLGPYLETLDAAFAFEVLQARPTATSIRTAIAHALQAGKSGWVLSNHDFHRLGSRSGPENARAMALLLLSLPGPAFMLDGDELGMIDRPPSADELDRAGRDGYRSPMPWDRDAPGLGFTTGAPWLPVGDGVTPTVTEQDHDPASFLALTRALIAARRDLSGDAEVLDTAEDTVVVRRGTHIIAINLGDTPRPAPPAESLLVEARRGDGSDLKMVPGHGGWVASTLREERVSRPVEVGMRPSVRGGTRRDPRSARIAATAAAMFAVGALIVGCGGSSSGAAQLNWYIFPEPSGSFAAAAKQCSTASHGQYTININTLPSDSDSQRTQLVRRLAAKDSGIDIIGMDVNWTAEFADAGWIKAWSGADAKAVTNGVLAGPIKTATWKGTLYGAPLNSNTQLLWYRKDLVPNPPKTWAQMIQMADQLAKQGKPHYIEVQGRQYEGLTVWFNSLVDSAGGQILSGPTTVDIGQPVAEAAKVMHDLATSAGADPILTNAQEDQGRLEFEKGVAAFEVNYPFVYPAAQADVPKLAKDMAWAPYPSITPGQPAKVTIGGINLGVSSYSPHPAAAFAAVKCLVGSQHQMTDAIKGGLPPTLGALYDSPELAEGVSVQGPDQAGAPGPGHPPADAGLL